MRHRKGRIAVSRLFNNGRDSGDHSRKSPAYGALVRTISKPMRTFSRHKVWGPAVAFLAGKRRIFKTDEPRITKIPSTDR
jgi:hypothetical protein